MSGHPEYWNNQLESGLAEMGLELSPARQQRLLEDRRSRREQMETKSNRENP